MNITEDIKTILAFYQALGFERLPIDCRLKGKSQRSNANDACSPTSQGVSRESRVRSHQSPVAGHRSYEKADDLDHQPSSITHHPSLDKTAALESLRVEMGDCRKCRLSGGRKNIVFGEGNPDAQLMFIGEAPGREEDIQARPFVGEAGQLLTRLIEKLGMKREEVYIGNICKCRPPQNRDPEEDEMRSCSPFIDNQIDIISPKVIIALGRVSAQTLIGTKVPISKLRGKFCEYKGIPLMPTFHPAYLLRNPKDKWLVWEDVQRVIERLKGRGEQE